MLSAGCTVGPTYHVPAAPTPTMPSYKESVGTWKLATPADAFPRGAWWLIFHEPELDALEARLNFSNQTIAIAFENFMAARAQIRAARAGYFPTVTASPAATWFRSSGVSSGLGTTSSGVSTQGSSSVAGRHRVFSAPLDVSWALDLFGRVRNTVREREYGAQMSAADLESTRLIAQTTLAQTYFQIRGQDALQDILDATVAADEQIVELTRSRFEAGIDPSVTLVQAELTLQNARIQATNVGILRAQLEHAIATLLGIPATDFTLPRRARLVRPPRIPIGTPSQLLERRPDIASAERQMASANAALGIAYAAYFPVVTLSGTVGFASATIGSLLTWPSRVWSIGASLLQTVFDAGLRRATLNQTIALYNATVASYRQTVLVAFQQVEDSLAQTRILAHETEQQHLAVKLAEDAFDLEKVRYEGGLDPYINLMLQQTALLAAQQALVSLRVAQMTNAVALVEALGGGWDRADLPTPSELSKRLPASAYRILR